MSATDLRRAMLNLNKYREIRIISLRQFLDEIIRP
jgi:hypothetical protein